MRRKIVQVVVTQRDGNHPDAIVALADDGTLWLGDLNVWLADWQQLPPLPEAKESPDAH